ncbi:MAG TPA: Gfo/Idh/MocA family oxidoreductase [Solirubrobacter sp.]|nr:Gfo/Idh/MocA family oxidoreductase [Solirubrobacter sp.]
MARRVGIIMNGVTGRMGTNQHLVRSILAIRQQGGVRSNGDVIWPEPLLVGRSEAKLAELAAEHGLERWTTDLDAALADPEYEVYFDAQVTSARPPAVEAAIAAGKHVYCEKPVTPDVESALALARAARDAGVKVGVVQDKLFLPGLLKLQRLVRSGFFGRIIAVRGEFGYWVYPGPEPKPQRPSWNYRSEDGGGIISDMFAHWRYVLDNVIGPVRSVMALGAIHLPKRIDERGNEYETTAEDAAYAIFEIDGGAIVQFNSSWCVRVNRDELLEIQIDGTHGSAVAGLRGCKVQPAVTTPKSIWNPDLPDPIDHRAAWTDVPDTEPLDNGFKLQWEHFLRHVVDDAPFQWDFLEGARGVQLSALGEQSWRERRWVDVPELTL